jgi:hypothetical protein
MKRGSGSQRSTYVTALHNEVTQENGMPPLGTQNQAIDFILGDFFSAIRNCAAH